MMAVKLTMALLIELAEAAEAPYIIGGELDTKLFLSYLKTNYEGVVLPEAEYKEYDLVSQYFDFPFDIPLEMPDPEKYREYRLECEFDFVVINVPDLGIDIRPLILESYPSGFI